MSADVHKVPQASGVLLVKGSGILNNQPEATITNDGHGTYTVTCILPGAPDWSDPPFEITTASFQAAMQAAVNYLQEV